MRWLSSLDELLFEVMSWLVFLPVTLWRAIRHPIDIMEYAEQELAVPKEERYQDILSPPIFLILCLLIAHLMEVLMGAPNTILKSRHGLAAYVNDDTSLIAMRILIFSIVPLVMATQALRTKGEKLTRSTLQPVFYAQCYPTAPFALALTLGLLVADLRAPLAHYSGSAFAIVALLAYFVVQARWSANEFGQTLIRGAGHAAVGIGESTAIIIIIALLLKP